ncbi:MAG TPA: response regulator transcription factor [Allosphingosinicella sp.]
MSAHILLVEDDPGLLAVLEASLSFGGFSCEAVSRGEDALAALGNRAFSGVLLDLGLPDCEGGELLPRLRAVSDIPIIVVSGRGSERDKIEALDLGADDFVAKPFLPGELLARIRAALRRYGQAERPQAGGAAGRARHPLQFGALTLDPVDNSAALGGATAKFNAAEFKVLHRLASRQWETVSRAELLGELYGAAAPAETNVVDVYISRVRAKLRGLPGGEDIIANVRGAGWRFRVPG